MKKRLFFYSLLAITLCVGSVFLSSCGDDEEETNNSSPSQLLSSLKNNQVSIFSHGIQSLPMVSLDITRPHTDYYGNLNPGNYRFMFFSDENSAEHVDLIMSLTPDMLNKTINLSSPSSTEGDLYLTFTIDPMEYKEGVNQFHGGMRISLSKGKLTENDYGYEDNGIPYEGKVTEGTITITHNGGDAKVEMQGKLSNGSPVAFKGHVPADEIRIYD